MASVEFLDNVKAGDRVTVYHSRNGEVGQFTVKRTTKTLLFIGKNELKFSRRSGSYGNRYRDHLFIGPIDRSSK